MANRRRRSDILLRIFEDFSETLIIMHNNPDPDAIGTGWALWTAAKRHSRKRVRLVARGPILRAENVQFVKLLKPPIEFVEAITLSPEKATILVDCSPGAANHVLGPTGVPTAVIDHHQPKGDGFRIRFRDMRPGATASASIAAQYLKEQKITPKPELATALFYAIRTEMVSARKQLSRLDHTALRWLSPFVDHDVLAEIESPPLPRYYYEELLLGLDSVRVYADTAICFLPRITAPEIVGESADLLIRCDVLDSVFCGGRIGNDFYMSARSKSDDRPALSSLHKCVNGLGHYGGHSHRAGGKIQIEQTGMTSDVLLKKLRTKWLDSVECPLRRGSRLLRGRSRASP